MDTPRLSLAPYLCLAGAVLLWGTSFTAMKYALMGFAPMVVVFLRMALASLLLLPAWGHVPKAGRRPGDLKWLALMCLLQPCLYFLLEGFAMSLTTSAQAGMISSLVPLLVAAGAYAFLGEPLGPRMVLGVCLSLGGVVWLSLCGAAEQAAPNPPLGNLLELFAMCCASGYMVVIKHLSRRYDSWHLTELQVFAGAVFFLPTALATDTRWLADPAGALAVVPLEAWLGVAYLGGVVTLGAFGMYHRAVVSLPSAQAAASINLVPLVAVLAGWAMLGERLALGQVLACGLILCGVLLGQTRGGRRAQDASPTGAPTADA
ncbi:Permease of the drug/metabolite transporter (DMT) superfamily [Humidesulfovibrio mexicanus]|uniref:Permease of the drug/metabolite transporter (DMT) superfamily n=1 Tax=Humidesulfovibrio mexicanus TaxID=147047 RepID=A0A239AYK1_9BACT|nr:DMT family transporter [Humidesulfovibrio mexicanus]SNS00707.1 Permease of the drug/metabolite transporter (DMT) superfamily [Humidesulfovibrio mexicanus]